MKAGDAKTRTAAVCLRGLLPAATLAATVLVPTLCYGESLAEYLDSGALKNISNPVPINYFLEQAPPSLSDADRTRAMEQINLALHRQTNALNNMLQGLNGMFGGTVTQQVNEQAQQQMSKTNLVKQMLLPHFGLNAPPPAPTQRQVQSMQEETKQSMSDPWIRGIESAQALARLGDAQSAGHFYMSCIQMVPPDWLADNCLNGILSMGPARAHALLTWLAGNAESAGFPTPGKPGAKDKPALNVVWLRSAALRGLGELVASGYLTAEQRESAMQPLLAYAQGADSAPYQAAAASGLGRARDPRGLEPLRRLLDSSKDPLVKEAAARALAVGFHEEQALQRIRGLLADKSPDVAFGAADALLAAGDPAVLDWARTMITARRAPDDATADLRPRVVRLLVAHRDQQSRQSLDAILKQGTGNDWLDAWIAVGLLEMGDRGQLEAVRAAVHKTDWTLDRATLGSAWRKIRPLVQLAVTAAVGGPVSPQAIAKVVVNMALAERAKAVERSNDREVASLQMRFEACDAFSEIDDAGAAAELTGLAADKEPAVRLSAARALAVQPGSGSLEGLVAAFHADFGEEDGTSRTPEVRAALLRAALDKAPNDAHVRSLVREAAASADAGIRFVGLVAQAHGDDKATRTSAL